MVSKASDDLPEPDSPVITTSLSRGRSSEMFLRLCSRAPRMEMNLEVILWAMSEGPGPSARLSLPGVERQGEGPRPLNQRQLLEAGPYGAGLAAEACGNRLHRLAVIMAALEVLLLGLSPRGIGVAMGFPHGRHIVALGVARTPGLAGQGRFARLGARATGGAESLVPPAELGQIEARRGPARGLRRRTELGVLRDRVGVHAQRLLVQAQQVKPRQAAQARQRDIALAIFERAGEIDDRFIERIGRA